MMLFYAQMSDHSSIHHPADRMEIVGDAIHVYKDGKLIAYVDLGATVYAHIYEKKG